MNKKLILAIGALFITLWAFTMDQKHGNFDFDKFKAEKIAFITEAISLTPAEAEKFWPVYNQFEKKKWELMQERHQLEQQLKENLKEMSDKEYIELSKQLAAFPKRDGELNLEYNDQFLKILSPRKVVLLYIAEVNFRGSLLKKYREKGPGNN